MALGIVPNLLGGLCFHGVRVFLCTLRTLVSAVLSLVRVYGYRWPETRAEDVRPFQPAAVARHSPPESDKPLARGRGRTAAKE